MLKNFSSTMVIRYPASELFATRNLGVIPASGALFRKRFEMRVSGFLTPLNYSAEITQDVVFDEA